MGQLRVIPWNTLVLAQEPADQHLVAGLLPVGGADDALDDHAVTIDQITLRYAEDVVRLPDRATGIVEDVEGEAEAIREAQDLGHDGRRLVGVQRVAVDTQPGERAGG